MIEIEEDKEILPNSFSVAVIMQQSPSENPWADDYWEAIGVSAGDSAQVTGYHTPLMIFEQAGVQLFLYPGFQITLYVDECESYYHNLISPTPRCYVVADYVDELPVPILVSLSFDEAQAYLEGEQIVYAVDIPAELYRWSEAFVLAHYVPEKKKKRKLKDWKSDGEGSCQL